MNNNFSNYNNIFKYILPFGYILVFSCVLSLGLFLYLPKVGVEFTKIDSYSTSSKRYNFVQAFDLKQQTVVKKKKDYQLLSNVELNAVYLSSKNKSWVVVNEKSSSKTHILSKNDKFKNYKLTKIYKEYVVFKKRKTEYKLQMKSKELKYEVLTKKKKKKHLRNVSLEPLDIKLSNTTKLGVK